MAASPARCLRAVAEGASFPTVTSVASAVRAWERFRQDVTLPPFLA